MSTNGIRPRPCSFADALIDPVGAKQKGWPHAVAISVAVGILTAGLAHIAAAIKRRFFCQKEPAANETYAKIARLFENLFGTATPEPGSHAKRFLIEFGVRLNADNTLDPKREVNRDALDKLRDQINANIPPAIQNCLGITIPLTLKQLDSLTKYSLLAITGRLPNEDANLAPDAWKQAFNATKGPDFASTDCPKEVHIPVENPRPVCIPAMLLSKARHLYLAKVDTFILHALPPTIESMTIVGGGPTALKRVAELKPLTLLGEEPLAKDRGQQPGAKLNRILLPGFTLGQEPPIQPKLMERYPNLKIVTTNNPQDVNACIPPNTVPVSNESLLEYYLGGTSDHTWKTYEFETRQTGTNGPVASRMKVGTFNLLDRCDVGQAGNNPAYIHETLDEYKTRKEKQIAEILKLLSGSPMVQGQPGQRAQLDVLALQETDFLYYAQVPDSGTPPACEPAMKRVCQELRKTLREELEKHGLKLVETAPGLPRQSSAAIIYRMGNFHQVSGNQGQPVPPYLTSCFPEQQQNGASTPPRGGYLLLEGGGGEHIQVATAHFSFTGKTQEEVAAYQQSVPYTTVVLGDYNRSPGQKGLKALVADPEYPTNVDTKDPSTRGNLEALSSVDSDERLRCYDGMAVKPGQGMDLCLWETEMKYYKKDSSWGGKVDLGYENFANKAPTTFLNGSATPTPQPGTQGPQAS